MIKPPPQAAIGDTVDLAVDVVGGQPGDAVTFEVRADDDVVATVSATIAGTTARAPWTVDVGDRALPLQVRFVARLQGEQAEAGVLEVVADHHIGLVAWQHNTMDGVMGQEAAVADVHLGDDLELDEGDAIGLVVDVGDDDFAPIKDDFELSVGFEREGAGGFEPIGDEQPQSVPPRGGTGRDQVTIPWTATAFGEDADQRVRAVVAWKRKPKQAGAPLERGEKRSEPVRVAVKAKIDAAPKPPDRGPPRLMWSLNHSKWADAQPVLPVPTERAAALLEIVKHVVNRVRERDALDTLMNNSDFEYSISGIDPTDPAEQWARLVAKHLNGNPYLATETPYPGGWPAHFIATHEYPYLLACQQSAHLALLFGDYQGGALRNAGIDCSEQCSDSIRTQAGDRYMTGYDYEKAVPGSVLIYYTPIKVLDQYTMTTGGKIGNVGHANLVLRKHPGSPKMWQRFETGGPGGYGIDHQDFDGTSELRWDSVQPTGGSGSNLSVRAVTPAGTAAYQAGRRAEIDRRGKLITDLETQIATCDAIINDKGRPAAERNSASNRRGPLVNKLNAERGSREKDAIALKASEDTGILAMHFDTVRVGLGPIWRDEKAPGRPFVGPRPVFDPLRPLRPRGMVRLAIYMRPPPGTKKEDPLTEITGAANLVFRSRWISTAKADVPLPLSQLAYSVRSAPGCNDYQVGWEVNTDHDGGQYSHYEVANVVVRRDGKFRIINKHNLASHGSTAEKESRLFKSDAGEARGGKPPLDLPSELVAKLDQLVADLSPTGPIGIILANGNLGITGPGWRLMALGGRVAPGDEGVKKLQLFAWRPGKVTGEDKGVSEWFVWAMPASTAVPPPRTGWWSTWGWSSGNLVDQLVFAGTNQQSFGREQVIRVHPSGDHTSDVEAWAYDRTHKVVNNKKVNEIFNDKVTTTTWTSIGAKDQLIYLGFENKQMMVWTPETANARVYEVKLHGKVLLPDPPLANTTLPITAVSDDTARLTYLGNNHLLVWSTTSLDYKVMRYNLKSAGLLVEHAKGKFPGGIPTHVVSAGNDRVLLVNTGNGTWVLHRYHRL